MPERTAVKAARVHPERRNFTPAEARRLLDSVYGRQPRNFSTNGNGIDLDANVAEDACLLELVRCLQKAGYAISDSVTWASLPTAFRLACQGGQGGHETGAAEIYDQPLQAPEGVGGGPVTSLSLGGQDANFQRAPKRQRLPERLTDAQVERILGPKKGR
jgi:hypothetical protein